MSQLELFAAPTLDSHTQDAVMVRRNRALSELAMETKHRRTMKPPLSNDSANWPEIVTFEGDPDAWKQETVAAYGEYLHLVARRRERASAEVRQWKCIASGVKRVKQGRDRATSEGRKPRNPEVLPTLAEQVAMEKRLRDAETELHALRRNFFNFEVRVNAHRDAIEAHREALSKT